MYEVVLSFYSYGWNQPRDHSNAKCLTVLSCSTVYCAVQGGSSFFVCVWNLVCHQSNGSHWAVLWFDSVGHALLENLPCSMQLFCSRTFKNSSTVYYPYVRYKIGIFALENPRTCSLHFDRFSSIAFFFAVLYSSGTSIASFPSDGLVIKQKLNHQGNEVVTGETKIEEDVAVLGLYQVPGPTSGRIVLYGDSNCLDNAHMEKGTDY